MMKRIAIRSAIVLVAVALLLAAGAAIGWGVQIARRPPRTEIAEPLFQGVQYSRMVRSVPRPVLIHVIKIDLAAPALRMMVTPPGGSGTGDMPARTTSSFLREYGVQVAINGNYFYRRGADLGWLNRIEPGDPVTVLGHAIEKGEPYSTDNPSWPVFCFGEDEASIVDMPPCPGDTVGALGGDVLILDGGKISHEGTRDDTPDPRTAVAVSPDGKTLWLIVADGRQPGYSEGLTLPELAALAGDLGAARCLNLDGGGSSTMAVSRNGRPHVLNAPYHGGIPMRERPVANHLGIFAGAL